MKKRILMMLSLTVLASATLTGCSSSNDTASNAEETSSTSKKESEKSNTLSQLDNCDIYEYVDPETGVHYLIYSNHVGRGGAGGMTPRLNADGSIMVDEKEEVE